MNDHNRSGLDEASRAQLNAYIDGCLTPEQKAGFEERLSQEPELRAEYELQLQLNQALSLSWSTQMERTGITAHQLRGQIKMAAKQSAADPSPHHGRRFPVVMRWAAVIGLVAAVGLGAWLLNRSDGPEGYPDPQYVALTSVYHAEIEEGFEPDWVCDNQRFTETIQEKLAARVSLSAMPEDRRMLGLSYVPRARTDTVVMLGRFNEEPVLVFFDRPQLVDQFYDLSVEPGMHLHQRDIGELRVVELSGHPEPVFLDFLD